ncbi:MAG TPA: helix-turn-helix domain-containing protein, partial [Diaminobutyricibacter sp.]
MPDHGHGRCSPDAMKLVADFWVLRIVEELNSSSGGLRFSVLERSLGGISPATLSNRLRRLEERDLIERREGADGPISVTYRLTDRGCKVLPVIHAIDDFADST